MLKFRLVARVEGNSSQLMTRICSFISRPFLSWWLQRWLKQNNFLRCLLSDVREVTFAKNRPEFLLSYRFGTMMAFPFRQLLMAQELRIISLSNRSISIEWNNQQKYTLNTEASICTISCCHGFIQQTSTCIHTRACA